MDAKLFHFLPSKPPFPTTLSSPKPLASAPKTSLTIFPLIRRHNPNNLCPIRRISTNANDTDTEPESDAVAQPEITPPPETVEVRFRRRSSKRRSRQQSDSNGGGAKATAASAPAKKKKWEDMTFAEKAAELYVGEKGALYWLNKFAYASIFIVIGGWIMFRFVGPALNLYQLDSPPLAPDAIFRGSS